MGRRNIDGIKKIKIPARQAKFFSSAGRHKARHQFRFSKAVWWGVLTSAFLAIISGSVMAVYANVPSLNAQSKVLGAFTAQASLESSADSLAAQNQDGADLSIFENTTLADLKEYVISQVAESQIEARKTKLKAYLQVKASPFVEDDKAVEAFARSPHMELMLAISFAESTLGKKCYFNNCSGIGGYVPTLRQYKETANWVYDFNRLLERKYKDWTLKEMCGVYVQPCNQSWLLATRSVLEELEASGVN